MTENTNPRPVGLTRKTGYQIGVRRTIPSALETCWELLVSPAGITCWLGEPAVLTLAAGEPYTLQDGTVGEIRVFRPASHLRLTWQPPGWARAATIQVRVMPRGERTTIAFHQEHLPDRASREVRRGHFTAALDALAELAGAG